MTNGERIQTILDVDRDCTEVHGENGTMTFTVTQDFWNAEYKEPTTKNEVRYCDRNICLKNIHNNIECEDCEVTIHNNRVKDELNRVKDELAVASELEKNSKLEKIKDQLKSNLRGVEITLEVLVENDPLRPKMERAKTTLEDCLELIDKAEAESI